ncbi:hypothetical protein PIIN_04098 [Serendipita indica DSM 11827]|uniref:N-acetyltransferase domain-containing protein n=1 Tax=Serendipita indica (strain DSM 11827) TaxID=1109443 RepID=G4TFR2_SERID|nr:hypothetical protein PIIN_04098 [Serendipita indica DSM 11827]
MTVVFRRLTPQDAVLYRLIRLRALVDSPHEFSSTFTRELAFTLDTWTVRLQNAEAATFIAYDSPPPDINLDGETKAVGETLEWKTPDEFALPTTHDDRFAAYKGMITCIRSFESPYEDAFVVGFWVLPAARSQGIGRTLVNHALEWAKSHDGDNIPFKRVLLDVVKNNVPARRAYERCGFVVQGESPEDAKEVRYVYKIR